MQGRFMMSTQYNYAGIDIAKRNFVIAVSSLSKTKTEINNPKGIAHTCISELQYHSNKPPGRHPRPPKADNR